ncbi:insoluble matrix shell protein 2-like [Ruditapes philippinarum]|uniref:insoluble matrix shell protein 2-like n=1 Tax=Ruditapes philippinarum TaxID=129788 RepID=UPI00295AEF1D|nr:insoluble matrix shell protein 2-like [Ruditapes philippinarum]
MELKACLILILLTHFVVAPIPSSEWREASIQLWRTVGSAHFAADFLGVTFKNIISAHERKNPRPRTAEYRVQFTATCNTGETVHCKADVLWNFTTIPVRSVSNESCVSPENMTGLMTYF